MKDSIYLDSDAANPMEANIKGVGQALEAVDWFFFVYIELVWLNMEIGNIC